MAYVPLTTVSDSDTILTAWGNQVKDNFAAGVPDIFTTKGDLAVATGNDVATRLAVGSDFQVLHALASETSGLGYIRGVWSRATKITAQSISNNTLTKIQIASAGGDDDPYSMFDGINYRLTIPSSFPPNRWYVAVVSGIFVAHATDGTQRRLEIQKNGSIAGGVSSVQATDNSRDTYLCATTPPTSMDAGDYFEAHCYQDSGGALDIQGVLFGLFMIR